MSVAWLAVLGVVNAVILIIAAIVFLGSRSVEITLAQVDPISRFVSVLTPRQRLSCSLLAVCIAGLTMYYSIGLVCP